MTPRPAVLFILVALLAWCAARLPAAAPDREEFFILSSVDAARGRIVLKRPTEVTLLMQVTGQTAYRDEQGKTLRLSDLRTGDTLFITFRRSAAGEATALRVRLGAMTLQLLGRYLKPVPP